MRTRDAGSARRATRVPLSEQSVTECWCGLKLLLCGPARGPGRAAPPGVGPVPLHAPRSTIVIGASPVKARDSSELGSARDIIQICALSKRCTTCLNEYQMQTAGASSCL